MADPGLKLELVTRDFNRMLEDLASIDPRVEFAQVIRSEAGAVAAGAMSRTKAASVANINKRADGRKFITLSGKTYYLANRYPDSVWEGVNQKAKDTRQNALNARGISKQSWFHAAKSFGKPMRAPAYVLNANYKGRQWPEDGSSMEEGTGTSFTLTMLNTSPSVQKANGQWALLGAMSARVRYFERNMEHFAFRTVESRAKKYPGIFAAPVPPPGSSVSEVATAE